jgi:hypothetical protein
MPLNTAADDGDKRTVEDPAAASSSIVFTAVQRAKVSSHR